MTKKTKRTDLAIWRDDFDTIFDFRDFEHYLAPYSIDRIIDVLYSSDETTLGKLNIVKTEYYNFFITPDKKAFTVIEGSNLDRTKRSNLEWLTEPVYLEDDDYDDFNTSFAEIWKNKWIPNTGKLENIVISGKTDFYDNFGWWPCAEIEEDETNELAPLAYFGEILVDNRVAYIFYGAHHKGEWIDLYFNIEDTHALVIFEDSELPKNVVRNKDNNEFPNYLQFLALYEEQFENFPDDVNKRFSPEGKLFNCIDTCQSYGDSPEGYPIPVYHIPVDFRFGEEENSGDLGSLLIWWDGNTSFKAQYQQT